MCKKWCAVQRKGRRIGSVIVTLGMMTVLLGYNWINEAMEVAHTMPSTDKINLYTWKEKEVLNDDNWSVLEEQTGVAVSVLQEKIELGDWQQVMKWQEQHYAPILLKTVKTTPLTVTEYVVDEEGNYVTGAELVEVKDGDILITKSSRFLGWRNGHAGLVVDAKRELVLEAVMLGVNTRLCRLSKWEQYPSFLVLRLKQKGAEKIGEKVADYAKEELVDIPYQLLAGVEEFFSKSKQNVIVAEEEKIDISPLEGTQCAHLIWYAYKQVGIDLDSDGGLIVTPDDIKNSIYLEVIQSYGY